MKKEFNKPERVEALAKHLECCPSTIEEVSDNNYTGQGKEFLVLTDGEADDLQDEYFENYIDDCLDIPEKMVNYFDREAWKRDAKADGRGRSLSSYDGEENYQGEFFIYRVN
jgi:hypothetical protein